MSIKLLPLNETDFPLVVEWINAHDKDFIYQWSGSTYKYPLTTQQMQEHYAKGINSIESGVYVYKIMDIEKEEVIGTVQLGNIDLQNKEATVGRFLIKSEQYRGQGIGTYVLNELVTLAFNQLSLQRLKLYVFNINKRAISCYEKVGFIQSDITYNVYQSINGEYWDRIEMILDLTKIN